jgi:hypothetical protein
MNPAEDVLDALVAIGESGVPAIPSCLSDPHNAWHMIICGTEAWQAVATAASDARLVALMRGLILYSRARPEASGGSASPAIVLYHE